MSKHGINPLAVSAAYAWDLRCVCLHEYAHLRIAQHFGLHGWVCIERNPNGGGEERFFSGSCAYFSTPKKKYHQRVIGLAGVAAEVYEAGGRHGVELGDALDGSLVELSVTDAAAAGSYTGTDLNRVMALVASLWPDIEREAERAVTRYTETSGAAHGAGGAPAQSDRTHEGRGVSRLRPDDLSIDEIVLLLCVRGDVDTTWLADPDLFPGPDYRAADGQIYWHRETLLAWVEGFASGHVVCWMGDVIDTTRELRESGRIAAISDDQARVGVIRHLTKLRVNRFDI